MPNKRASTLAAAFTLMLQLNTGEVVRSSVIGGQVEYTSKGQKMCSGLGVRGISREDKKISTHTTQKKLTLKESEAFARTHTHASTRCDAATHTCTRTKKRRNEEGTRMHAQTIYTEHTTDY